jgi:hypothetical protein
MARVLAWCFLNLDGVQDPFLEKILGVSVNGIFPSSDPSLYDDDSMQVSLCVSSEREIQDPTTNQEDEG